MGLPTGWRTVRGRRGRMINAWPFVSNNAMLAGAKKDLTEFSAGSPHITLEDRIGGETASPTTNAWTKVSKT